MSRIAALVVFLLHISVFSFLTPQQVQAQGQVCISSEEATNLIQILDATDKQIDLLENCTALVDKLYQEIEIRDKIIEQLTEENSELRKEIARLERKIYRERYLKYAGIGAIIFSIIKIASAAAAI